MANFSLKLKADFDEAIADFKKLESVSAEAAAKIQRFTDGFKTEQIDRFIAKNKLNATAIKATQGPLAALQAETKGLEREIQRLIKSGLSPEDVAVRKLQADYAKLNTQLNNATQKTSTFGSVLKGVLTASFFMRGFDLLRSGIASVIEEASRFETSIANFTTMLGGSEAAAHGLVNQLQVLGARTPFEFSDLADATQLMIGFGAATENDVIDKLRMLGDVAQGNREKLQSIALAYSQIQASGKASMQDINQLTNAGVPILKQLAKQWGLTGADAIGQARAMATAGRATGEEVTRAFEQMTSEGGMFYGGMERASRTFDGVMSTLQDNIKMAAIDIGNELLPSLKNLALAISDTTQSSGAFTAILKDMAQDTAAVVNTTAQLIKLFNSSGTSSDSASAGFAKVAGVLKEIINLYTPIGLVINSFRAWGAILSETPVDRFTQQTSQLSGVTTDLVMRYGTLQNALRNTGDAGVQEYKRLREELDRLRGSFFSVQTAANASLSAVLSTLQAGGSATAAQTENARRAIINNQNVSASYRARADAVKQMANRTNEIEIAANEMSLSALSDFMVERSEREGENAEERMQSLQDQAAAINKISFDSEDARLKYAKSVNEAIAAERTKNFHRAAQAGSQMLAGTASLFQSLLQIMQNAGKSSYAMAVTLKTISAAEALVNSYLAFTQVLADKTIWPTWARIPIASVILAAGIAKATAIATTPIPSGQTGLDYTVPDTPAMRNDRAPVMASAGENVQITPRGEEPSGSGDTVVNIDVGENNLFRIIQRGINTGKIDISRRNVGRGVFAT